MQKLLISFFVAVISLSAVTAQENVLDRKVNYRATNRDLSNILVDLSKKSSVNIVFKIGDIPEKTLNFYSPDHNLKEILDFLLEGSGLKYDVIDRQIVIYKPGNDFREKYYIKGYTSDSKTGEKLIYTNIYLDDFSRGTVSNEHGFFILELYKGKNKLNFSYLGYHKFVFEIDLQKDLSVNISLNPEPARELKEVLITDKRQYNNRMEFYEPDVINVDRIDKMVHLFGEDDILRLTHIQPGVLTGSDGFGGIHVRGSSAGDNEIILDGVPVYSAQHAIGLFSIFNSSLIKNSTLLKGNFPARYGGSLGSVLDIRTRDGNNKKFGGELDLGLLTIKGLLEGPIVNEKSSMIISFRRTFIDVWNNSISELISSDKESKKFNYYFYDMNVKMNFHLNTKNHLFLSFYRGGDKFENSVKSFQDIEQDSVTGSSNSDWKWGNTLLSAQWNSQPGKRLFVNTTLYYSNFDLKSYSYSTNLVQNKPAQHFYDGKIFDSDIVETGIKLDFDLSLDSGILKWGYLLSHRSINPFVYQTSRTLSQIPDQLPNVSDIRLEIDNYSNNTTEHRIYFEDKVKLTRKTSFNFGLHQAFIITTGKMYYSFEPRIDFRQRINKLGIFKLSLGKMSQSIHTLTNNSLGLPSEIILPSTTKLAPESIWHYNFGIESDISKKIKLSIDAYYKTATNTVSYKEGSYFVISENSDWEGSVPVGLSKMYGIETQLEFNSEKIKSWLNYTYSFSLRSYENIFDGQWFDYRFSRRHMINFILFYKLNDKMNFFLENIYGSGNPYTLPTQLTPDNQLIYEKLNNWNLPYYHRIDIGLETKFQSVNVGHEIKFGIYNLLNRKNPFYMTFGSMKKQLLSSDFKYIYVFPFLPSVSYKITF
jgi:hypothetical protein